MAPSSADRTRRLRPALLATLTLASAGLLAGIVWYRGDAAQSGLPAHGSLRGCNVLLITIDTLRADRLGAYGHRGNLTPALDRLASSGWRVERAYSHAPMTLPAHASLLTGVLPTRHGVRNNGAFRLGREPVTLSDRLKRAGYRTAAFVGAAVLDVRYGLDRGFDAYDDKYAEARGAPDFYVVERRAPDVLRPALEWILDARAAPGPWFAWVHLFDPHAPYRAPHEYSTGRSPYDAEVAYTDRALSDALEQLRTGGQLDRTLIIVTADHGESLGEHGETTHGLFAYESTLRVPLIVTGPRIDARVLTGPAAHVDVMPTVLDLLGLEGEPGLDGRSIVDASGTAAIYFEALDANLTRDWAPLTGIVSGNWKYVDLPVPELYDLGADPAEQRNLVSDEPQRLRQMAARLTQFAQEHAGSSARSRTPSAAETARLQSLGYVGGSVPARRDAFTEDDDPKRLVSLSETFNDALQKYAAGQAEAALASLEQVIRHRPDFMTARTTAATILISSQRAGEAIRLLRAAPASAATSPLLLMKLAAALEATGDLRAAHDTFARAAAAAPDDPEPLSALGVVLAKLGRRDEARQHFERALAIDPSAAGTWYNLGVLEMEARRLPHAAAAFRKAVDIDSGNGPAWHGLGSALSVTSPAEAVDAWQHATALLPRDYDIVFNLGMLLADMGRTADAAPYLRRFLDEAPAPRYGRDFGAVRARLRGQGSGVRGQRR